jgi:hypothetical protein
MQLQIQMCVEPAISLHSYTIPLVQWSTPLLPVMRDPDYSVPPKTWPLFKNMPPPLCVSGRFLIFVSGRYIYVQSKTAVLLSYVGKSGQDEAFHMAISITIQQKLYI